MNKLKAAIALAFIYLISDPTHILATSHTDPISSFFIPSQNLPQPGQSGILATFFAPLINIVIVITGISSFLVIIFAGIRYVSSAGNADETQKATSMLTYSLVGLGLSAIAFWFTRIVFSIGGAGGLF